MLTQYHSTELPYSCLTRDEHGRYRQMGDWFLLEAVDADEQPTPVGEICDHLLVSNLANWLHPVIRLRIDDQVRVVERAGSSAAPRLVFEWVERKKPLLALTNGLKTVSVDGIALTSILSRYVGIRTHQIVCERRSGLQIRIRAHANCDLQALLGCVKSDVLDYLQTVDLEGCNVAVVNADPLPSAGAKRPSLLNLHE